MEILSRKVVEVDFSPNLNKLNNLFGDFDLYSYLVGEDDRYGFNSYVSKGGNRCVLVLPKARFKDINRSVCLILDRTHFIGLNPYKVSPWYTSPDNSRAVVLSASDFIADKIKHFPDGFDARGISEDNAECLEFKYWLSQVKDEYAHSPWITSSGWLYLG